MDGIIELDNVSFAAQDRVIIQNFSYKFEEGKTTALVGASGSGKSTVLKLSAGLLVPGEGRVSYRGKDIFLMDRKETLDFRREASVVFQDAALWANQNIFQILELPLRIHFPQMSRNDRTSRVREVLGEVGYKRDMFIRPDQLSMGEQKLIAFARALMCRPTLMFLDECTESVDDSAAQRLINIVLSHQKKHDTIIFVSHDFRMIKNLADYILMVKAGEFFRLFTREQIAKDENLAEYLEKGIAL